MSGRNLFAGLELLRVGGRLRLEYRWLLVVIGPVNHC